MTSIALFVVPDPPTAAPRRGPWPAAILMAAALCVTVTEAGASVASDRLKTQIDRLRVARTLSIGEARLVSSAVLSEFYGRRSFRPAWDRASAESLLAEIRSSGADGLEPADYHLGALDALGAVRDSAAPARLVERDLLLTDAFARLLLHHWAGKVEPETLETRWSVPRRLGGRDVAHMMQQALDQNAIADTIDAMRPHHPIYDGLKRGLAQLRLLAARKPKLVASGPTLERGMRGPRVVRLRQRLAATGDLWWGASDTLALFDEGLEQIVRDFQRRNGLAEDGSVGPGTLRAINLPPARRIDQVLANLERARWVLHGLDSTYVFVNVANYRVDLVEGHRVAWSARTQVGKTERETPVFKARMTHLIFNPTWIVPPTIFDEDYIPHLLLDSTYLASKKILVLDAKGQELKQDTIAWNRYDAKTLPYTLRQDPGPENPLGQVKFLLPNKHAIYLHDTPKRELFEHSQRAFSSGCIRVEHPLELAERVLQGSEWTRPRIDSVLALAEPTTAHLARPLPVVVGYWTSWPAADGRLQYVRDPYGRDTSIVASLARPQGRRRPVEFLPPPETFRANADSLPAWPTPPVRESPRRTPDRRRGVRVRRNRPSARGTNDEAERLEETFRL